MSGTQRIVAALKRTLRARSVTYAELGRRIGLSTPSVKRVLSQGSLSLPRLERICAALDLSIEELVRLSSDGTEEPTSILSQAQEAALAANPRLLACFYLLVNGRMPKEAATELAMDERELRRLLVRLDDLGLVQLRPRLGAHLKIGPVIAWRHDGPVRRVYERFVREEFMRSKFDAANCALQFRSAELSEASRRVLLRKIERLAADFADLAELDRSLPSREKHSTAMLIACRPWVLSMFRGLQAKSVHARGPHR